MIFWGKFSLNKQFFKFLYGHEIFFLSSKKYLLSDIVDYIFQLIQRSSIKRTNLTPTRL